MLAKRKTKAMKEMEDESAKRAETKGKSAVRRANMTQQFVIPDHTTADYERQLKKIATRGGEMMIMFFMQQAKLFVGTGCMSHVHLGRWMRTAVHEGGGVLTRAFR